MAAKEIAKKIAPLFDRVLVHRFTQAAATKAGILLPTAGTKLNKGEVLAVGPGAPKEDGNLAAMHLKVGDKVLLADYYGTEVKIDDEQFLIISQNEILAKLK